MKIYNEIITIFNENTGLWDTISEDSYNYNGPVALAQGLPVHATPVSSTDTIADTVKHTAGYFTGGDGTLSGVEIHTGSLSASNEKYYFNVCQLDPSASKSEVQFAVTFGHIAGSGSDQYGDTVDSPANLIGQSQAIYKQYSSILLHEDEQAAGFKISQQGSSSVLGSDIRDDYIYVLVAKKEKFKDRVNKKSWTLRLSGSEWGVNGVTGSELVLTDDSNQWTNNSKSGSVATPSGPRFNIVSGALGVVHTDSTVKTYGWFYPERGLFVLSGAELSASLPSGPDFPGSGSTSEIVGALTASNASNYFSSSTALTLPAGIAVGDIVEILSSSAAGVYNFTTQISGSAPTTDGFTGSVAWTGASNTLGRLTASIGNDTTNITASFSNTNHSTRSNSSGFAPNLHAGGGSDPKNALRFVNCLRNVSSDNVFVLRSEEDATEETHFCRIKAQDYNFSANPTFSGGSDHKVRHKLMHGNPSTFITGVGLYNSAGNLLAVAQLSKPLLKTFASEATIKVKLTY
jgi:hypothetical protein